MRSLQPPNLAGAVINSLSHLFESAYNISFDSLMHFACLFFKSEALEVLIIIESLWCPGGIYCSGLFLGTVGPTNTHKKLAYELMDWDRADNVLFTSSTGLVADLEQIMSEKND